MPGKAGKMLEDVHRCQYYPILQIDIDFDFLFEYIYIYKFIYIYIHVYEKITIFIANTPTVGDQKQKPGRLQKHVMLLHHIQGVCKFYVILHDNLSTFLFVDMHRLFWYPVL